MKSLQKKLFNLFGFKETLLIFLSLPFMLTGDKDINLINWRNFMNPHLPERHKNYWTGAKVDIKVYTEFGRTGEVRITARRNFYKRNMIIPEVFEIYIDRDMELEYKYPVFLNRPNVYVFLKYSNGKPTELYEGFFDKNLDGFNGNEKSLGVFKIGELLEIENK